MYKKADLPSEVFNCTYIHATGKQVLIYLHTKFEKQFDDAIGLWDTKPHRDLKEKTPISHNQSPSTQ